jgi:hypothetical protein
VSLTSLDTPRVRDAFARQNIFFQVKRRVAFEQRMAIIAAKSVFFSAIQDCHFCAFGDFHLAQRVNAIRMQLRNGVDKRKRSRHRREWAFIVFDLRRKVVDTKEKENKK